MSNTMLTQHPHTPGEVGTMYNDYTDVFNRALGGNIHVGYWDDDFDDTPVPEATDRLSGLVAERLAPAEGDDLIDVGCGHGSTAMYIAARHAVQITGVSVSKYQVELANGRPQPADVPGQATFRVADAMELPFADESFHGAYAIESLMHMKDKEAAMRHIARCLRPGGRLVVAEAFLGGELDRSDVALMADTCSFFKLSMTSDVYRQLMEEAGLKVVDLTDVSENIRRSYGIMADTWREAAREVDGAKASEWKTAADLTEWFGTVSQVRYGLMTAVRP
ncbi:methyltransferase domain-containing protein [Streptomyces sp. NPDC002668]|uniref:SAM-dependent methyltransferase n=1 Tax=Streptomyces sp. NPDC002668 TaxID=3154422 RepID=UPI00332AEA2F